MEIPTFDYSIPGRTCWEHKLLFLKLHCRFSCVMSRPLEGRLKDVATRKFHFPFTPFLSRLSPGCWLPWKEGIEGVGFTSFLTGVLSLDSVTCLSGFVETASWSGRPAGAESCYPKFFTAAKLASRYVGKLNLILWLVF